MLCFPAYGSPDLVLTGVLPVYAVFMPDHLALPLRPDPLGDGTLAPQMEAPVFLSSCSWFTFICHPLYLYVYLSVSYTPHRFSAPSQENRILASTGLIGLKQLLPSLRVLPLTLLSSPSSLLPFPLLFLHTCFSFPPSYTYSPSLTLLTLLPL